jgi:hypothetical protein
MTKVFDCIAEKRRIQAEMYEEIKDMSDAERQAWSRRRLESGPFAAEWKALWAANDARAEEARRRREG